MTTTPTRTRTRYVEVILIVFGVYSVILGLFMFIAPGTFFDTLEASAPATTTTSSTTPRSSCRSV